MFCRSMFEIHIVSLTVILGIFIVQVKKFYINVEYFVFI